MAFTRAEVEAMNEADLRKRVLIPLFQAMGYLDVYHHHGGAGEKGKDIVMWQRDAIRHRINFATVVKATRINGRVTGTSSAGEVCTQIQQCFGAPYRDLPTLEEHFIDRCIVVSSREISKEARDSIASVLASTKADGRVDFIDGDRLWGLIEEFLRESKAINKLSEAQGIFESVSPHHRIAATVDGGGIVLTTQPKHSDAYTAEPLLFNASFAYPKTEEGQVALKALERHFETGAPVTVPGDFIKDFTAPEFIQRFLRDAPDGMQLQIGARRLTKPIVATLVFAPDKGAPLTIENIDFRGVQVGTNELTLDNSHQPIPWHFRVTINFPERRINIAYTATNLTANVKQQLEAARLQSAFTAGGTILIQSADTSIPLTGGRIPPGTGGPPDDGFVRFLEELYFIQTKTRTPLMVPDRSISGAEVEAVFDLAHRLRHGVVDGTSTGLTVEVDRHFVESVLAMEEQIAVQPMTFDEQQVWTILDSEVRVGRVVTTVSGLALPPSEAQRLQDALTKDNVADAFSVRFEARESPAQVVVRYVDYLPPEELQIAFSPS